MATDHTITLEDRHEEIDHPEFHEVASFGNRLGESTLQALEKDSPTDRPDGRGQKPDEWQMRMHFSLPQLDVDAFTEKNDGCVVFPDILRHRLNPTKTPTEKGSGVLIRGKKGSGKTTLRNNIAVHLLDQNQERVVDRGRSADSGWLNLRWWTTLWLPANASVNAEWVYEGSETESRKPVDDLDEIVRSVRYYDDVLDLVDKLGDTPVSSYHVVYPDPSFAGCEEVMRRCDRTPVHLPYTPEWEAGEQQSPTPLPQWWHAFIVAQLEHGHFDAFMSLLLDEFHELFPPNPSDDDHRTDKKLNLMQHMLNSARKRMLSWYGFTQYEHKVDYRVLMEVMTRVYLADDRSNPVTDVQRTIPKGFDNVPMDADFLPNRTKGTGLAFIDAKNSGYAEFQWTDMNEYTHPEDENRWLQITLGEPNTKVRTSEHTAAEDDTPTLEYDETFFEHHDQTDKLYVRAPGDGQIDLESNTIVESLEAPDADHFLEEIQHVEIYDSLHRSDDGKHWIVAGEVGIADENGGVQVEETALARLPIDDDSEVSG